MSSFRKLLQVLGIGIYIDSSAPRFWRNQIEWELLKQLDGIGGGNAKADVEKGRIVISSFDQRPASSDFDVIVPENFEFGRSGGIFVDHETRIAMQWQGNALKLWVASKPLHLSVPVYLRDFLEKSGLRYLHGAAFRFKDEGVLVSAFGGIGKTSLVSQLLTRNLEAQLLGDDLVLIRRDGVIEPYLKPFCIYPYHSALFPKLFEERRAQILQHNLFSRILTRALLQLTAKLPYGLDFKTFRADEVLPKEMLCDQPVPLSRVYIVERSQTLQSDYELKPSSREYAASFSTNVMFHEWGDYLKSFIKLRSGLEKSFSNELQEYEAHFQEAFSMAEIQHVLLNDCLSPGQTASVLRSILFEG